MANSAVGYFWNQENPSIFHSAIKCTTACTSVKNSQPGLQSFFFQNYWKMNSMLKLHSSCFCSLIWPHPTSVDCLCQDFIHCFFSLSPLCQLKCFSVEVLYLLLSVSLKGINLSWSKVQVNTVMYIHQEKLFTS